MILPHRNRPRHGFLAAGVTLGLLVIATGARAEQPSDALCNAETSGYGTDACLHRALDAADHRLNVAYRKALSSIDQDDASDAQARMQWRAQFTAAQRAWIAFRDSDCGDLTLSEWHSGSGTTAATYECRYDKTVQRTAEILSRYPLN